MYWSEKEQSHLLEAIPSYREKIKNKDITVAKRITLELAEEIHQSVPDVQGRTVNAINERLPYLENLLAGIFEAHHYAAKDRELYSTFRRENGSVDPNLCNTRHKYNGAMTEWRKKNE
ncbi:hypothetical protein ABLO26_24595 [Neobacillus sp. 179-J 1A1 HS]|uniref:hypothetical protein n=1 Tax=Neobacillus driksii TaxID=3035913 RepID=UPI0035BC32E2